MLCEAGVVLGINYCEFAASQGDFSEGVAVAEPAIKKQQADTYPFEPKGDWNNDVNNSSSINDRRQKSEDRCQGLFGLRAKSTHP